jgi:hypothetical protein
VLLAAVVEDFLADLFFLPETSHVLRELKREPFQNNTREYCIAVELTMYSTVTVNS